jgi:hypothetical protein
MQGPGNNYLSHSVYDCKALSNASVVIARLGLTLSCSIVEIKWAFLSPLLICTWASLLLLSFCVPFFYPCISTVTPHLSLLHSS